MTRRPCAVCAQRYLKGNGNMRNLMTIGYAAVQTNKENGNEFVAVKGNVVVDGKLVNAQLNIDGKTTGDYDRVKSIAGKFREADEAGMAEAYPRGLAIEAPFGFSIDWDQERKPFVHEKGPRKGQTDISPYSVRVIRGDGPSLRLTLAPPMKVEVDPAAEELLKQYGV